MDRMTFKERVVSVATAQARVYQDVFVNYEYLICSDAFVIQDYYILSAKGDNYQHLVGVNTPDLSPQGFFEKCICGTLQESDFDFHKRGRTEGSVKGSVRKKLKALPFYTSMFERDLAVQESFTQNQVICSFAATDDSMTIGYINNKKAVPKSLMSGDTLDWGQAGVVELIAKRKVGDDLFSELVFGGSDAVQKFYPKIRSLICLT